MHFACLMSMVLSKRPVLLFLSPVCRAWCNATDFAAKCPLQMKRLISERSKQTAIMSNIVQLIDVVMAYGGHIMLENPTHSKFWQQPFMRHIEAATSNKHVGRYFRVNRCRVGGVHFKQFNFYTSLPESKTKHLELTCNHHFKHPPCLGRDANGNSVTCASGVYTPQLVFMLITCVGLLVGLPDTLAKIGIPVHEAYASRHETYLVDVPFEKATTSSYLRGACGDRLSHPVGLTGMHTSPSTLCALEHNDHSVCSLDATGHDTIRGPALPERLCASCPTPRLRGGASYAPMDERSRGTLGDARRAFST